MLPYTNISPNDTLRGSKTDICIYKLQRLHNDITTTSVILISTKRYTKRANTKMEKKKNSSLLQRDVVQYKLTTIELLAGKKLRIIQTLYIVQNCILVAHAKKFSYPYIYFCTYFLHLTFANAPLETTTWHRIVRFNDTWSVDKYINFLLSRLHFESSCRWTN